MEPEQSTPETKTKKELQRDRIRKLVHQMREIDQYENKDTQNKAFEVLLSELTMSNAKEMIEQLAYILNDSERKKKFFRTLGALGGAEPETSEKNKG